MKNSTPRQKTSRPHTAETTNSTSADWYSRHDLAKHYKVSVRTVDAWTASNLVPFRKFGRRLIFNLAQVEAVLSSRFDVSAKNT
jgi:hypothetical protein